MKRSCIFTVYLQCSFIMSSGDREVYERRYEMLLEDNLGEVKEANRTERLLPVRQVVDQLGCVRRHNYARRDRALLGHV